ncbi:MazG nucleotide pyrophosphohydrolase domain-containing protein [Desulfosediminicola sp.]|uniref:MazG nucleotide pyrophosphohydrolase domain-containing protein n=1 Tax=Desulfosediminicola sp. TaxID=2886825 RepID=UPI003AF22671
MSDNQSNFLRLVDTIRELRSENGCPWDKRQTTSSMVKYLHSEFDELVEAIDKKDTENICEELGDLLFILVMISEINSESGKFTLDQVINGITEKLVRRHPHVFAGVEITDEDELKEQWRKIKAEEKSKK